MWLVALQVPGVEAVRVLRKSGCFCAGASASDPLNLEAVATELSDVLSALFLPGDDYWQSVVNGGSGMGLSKQAEAEEIGRRQENLEHLHQLAQELQSEITKPEVLQFIDMSNTACIESSKHQETGRLLPEGGPQGLSRSEVEASTDFMVTEFGQYLDGTHGFARLCAALGIKSGIEFDALAHSFSCGSKSAQCLSSRQDFFPHSDQSVLQ
jgi:hypothetical protein